MTRSHIKPPVSNRRRRQATPGCPEQKCHRLPAAPAGHPRTPRAPRARNEPRLRLKDQGQRRAQGPQTPRPGQVKRRRGCQRGRRRSCSVPTRISGDPGSRGGRRGRRKGWGEGSPQRTRNNSHKTIIKAPGAPGRRRAGVRETRLTTTSIPLGRPREPTGPAASPWPLSLNLPGSGGSRALPSHRPGPDPGP